MQDVTLKHGDEDLLKVVPVPRSAALPINWTQLAHAPDGGSKGLHDDCRFLGKIELRSTQALLPQ